MGTVDGTWAQVNEGFRGEASWYTGLKSHAQNGVIGTAQCMGTVAQDLLGHHLKETQVEEVDGDNGPTRSGNAPASSDGQDLVAASVAQGSYGHGGNTDTRQSPTGQIASHNNECGHVQTPVKEKRPVGAHLIEKRNDMWGGGAVTDVITAAAKTAPVAVTEEIKHAEDNLCKLKR